MRRLQSSGEAVEEFWRLSQELALLRTVPKEMAESSFDGTERFATLQAIADDGTVTTANRDN